MPDRFSVATPGGFETFRAPFRKNAETHGTGCNRVFAAERHNKFARIQQLADNILNTGAHGVRGAGVGRKLEEGVNTVRPRLDAKSNVV